LPAATPDFRELLALLMLSSMSGGFMGSAGGSDLGALGLNPGGNMPGMNMLLAPLMLTLLERLTEQQVDTTPNPPLSTTAPGAAIQGASAPEAEQAPSKPAGMPVQGRISQYSHAGHVALDIAVPVGTKIKSTMAGRVVFAGWNTQGYGNLVIIENGPWRTYYAHLSKIPVKTGEQVKAGELIGISGNTGNSTGPHLHYEIRKYGRLLDPTKFT
jgi:murein DD-endopeptidase MepM/ murein hydrolase activator NlpD